MAVVVLYGSFCFQAEDGIRDLVRSRGLGDVYKRQDLTRIRTIIDADYEVEGDLRKHVQMDIKRLMDIGLSLIHI